jgi:hypothetical protein
MEQYRTVPPSTPLISKLTHSQRKGEAHKKRPDFTDRA